jgi:hypothetical protein
MNKIVVYSTEHWDDLADIPLFHMSYLIHVLLPRRHFGLERVLIEKKRVLEGFSKIVEDKEYDIHCTLLVQIHNRLYISCIY